MVYVIRYNTDGVKRVSRVFVSDVVACSECGVKVHKGDVTQHNKYSHKVVTNGR